MFSPRSVRNPKAMMAVQNRSIISDLQRAPLAGRK